MPGNSFPPQAAGATLAALERYQSRLRQLVAHWMDMELYRTVSDDLEQVRHCCRRLPQLSAGWVGLLIAHAELAHALWDSSRAGSQVTAAERQRLLAQAEGRVHALQALCMELLSPGRG
jgi:hypothetical protein